MIAIKVEGLSKKYHIGGKQERYRTLRDTLTDAFVLPFRKVGRLLKGHASGASDLHESIWALKDVSFEVKQGEVIGIIGRNGAGKSTLLKILSRITEPTEGYVDIYGRVGSLLEVGTGFHSELTGRENIYLNGAILGMKRAEINKKFDEIVAFAEVEKFIDTPVKHYSTGMYLRLAFAVAAHLEPEILLVDEVLAVGDAAFQKKCLGKMGDVAKEGRTVLFVSHNMAAISTLCTRAFIVEKGHKVSEGDPNEQIEIYLHSVQERTNLNLNKPLKLGSNLTLQKFEFLPNPIDSGGNLDFKIEIEGMKQDHINSIVILFYSCLGTRVAILDLRNKSFPLKVSEIKPIIIKGKIKTLPLVEGEYKVGLYINSSEIIRNFYDLITIRIKQEARNEIIPYPQNVRGFIELDYEIYY